MVFNSAPESETTSPPSLSMASTFSTKSHPLHNFPLSNVKWSMNHSNHHHHHHRSSSKNGDSGHSKEQLRPTSMIKLKANSSGCVHHESLNDTTNSGVSGKKRGLSVISGTERVMEEEKKKKKEEKKMVAVMSSIESSEKKLIGNNDIRVEKNHEKLKGSEGKPKILIRIAARNEAAVQEHQCLNDVEQEEPVAARTWNLRPRKAVAKPQKVNGAPQAQSRPEMALARAAPKEKVAPKRKGFSVSLSKEEIEEDFLILTGSKPPRRPKKRARNVQKQLDETFPGVWLPTAVTRDMS